ncbi:MAG: DNA replication/repair protein RecF [Gammaproteobacteria bacterium]|nr:DNA replication/repair protein RecF [Gammaproteobacteria bacterium]
MSVKKLNIKNFRNLSSVEIDLSDNFNVFYGENGAGKTSLLEALYYLSLGRSFRTHINQRIIQHNHNTLSIVASISDKNNSATLIGLERQQDGSRRIRLNGESIASAAALAELLPLQLLSTYSYRYFHDGPKTRRRFLDLGLYYLHDNYLSEWKAYYRILKQRNAGLKAGLPFAEINIWNEELIRLGNQIDACRQSYIDMLEPMLREILTQLLPGETLTLRYSRGWKRGKTLESLLKESLSHDLQLGYTYYGPQRADLQLYKKNVPVQDYLSQGQQKLAAYALQLAQGLLLFKQTQQTPIYLIDDLPSELDISKQRIIHKILIELDAQVLITGVNPSDLHELNQLPKSQAFHVKLGGVYLEPLKCPA